jgi:hypothetical protein
MKTLLKKLKISFFKLIAIASISQFKITNVESEDTCFFKILFNWKILLTY